jgi:hypothetical protein
MEVGIMLLVAVLLPLLLTRSPTEDESPDLGGIIRYTDKEIFAERLAHVSDSELLEGKKVIEELKRLITMEMRSRRLTELLAMNKAFEDRWGDELKAFSRACKDHIYLLDGSADCGYVEPHYYRKSEFYDTEGEAVEGVNQVTGMLKSYQRILEAGRAINQRVSNKDVLPYYDLTTFLDDGKEKKVPAFGKEVNIMYHLKNEGYKPYSEECEPCPACYTQDVGEAKYYDMREDIEDPFLCPKYPTYYVSDYEPTYQEMAGAPVNPDYITYSCFACGYTDSKRGDAWIGTGVDLMGQPIYAGMSTREVAELCVCNNPDYHPSECINPNCLAADAGYVRRGDRWVHHSEI